MTFDSAVLGQALRDYQRLIDGGETGRDISALFRIKSQHASAELLRPPRV